MKKALVTFMTAIFLFSGFPHIQAEGSASDSAVFPLSCDQSTPDNSYCDLAEGDDNPAKIFNTLKQKYHKDTNTYFAEKIKKLGGTTLRHDANWEKEAGGNDILNVYTDRIAELHKYEAALGTLLEKSGETTPQNFTDREEAFQAINNFADEIQWEQVVAVRALRLTIRSYGEMRIFYALHKELENLIPELQKLQSAWIKFVEQIARMPAKFINASRNSQ